MAAHLVTPCVKDEDAEDVRHPKSESAEHPPEDAPNRANPVAASSSDDSHALAAHLSGALKVDAAGPPSSQTPRDAGHAASKGETKNLVTLSESGTKADAEVSRALAASAETAPVLSQKAKAPPPGPPAGPAPRAPAADPPPAPTRRPPPHPHNQRQRHQGICTADSLAERRFQLGRFEPMDFKEPAQSASSEKDLGHFSLCTRKHGDVKVCRDYRDREVAMTPATVVCMQEMRLSTENVITSASCADTGKSKGWRLQEYSSAYTPPELHPKVAADIQNGKPYAFAGCHGLMVFAEAAMTQHVLCPRAPHTSKKSTHHLFTHIRFNRKLGGFTEFGLVNGHWHRDMAANRSGWKDARKAAVDDLAKVIEDENVRFVVGDFNMSAYELKNDLFKKGIEGELLIL